MGNTNLIECENAGALGVNEGRNCIRLICIASSINRNLTASVAHAILVRGHKKKQKIKVFA